MNIANFVGIEVALATHMWIECRTAPLSTKGAFGFGCTVAGSSACIRVFAAGEAAVCFAGAVVILKSLVSILQLVHVNGLAAAGAGVAASTILTLHVAALVSELCESRPLTWNTVEVFLDILLVKGGFVEALLA